MGSAPKFIQKTFLACCLLYVVNVAANEPRIFQIVPNKGSQDSRPIIINVPQSSSVQTYQPPPQYYYPFPWFFPQQQQQQQQQQQSGGETPYVIIVNPTNRNDHDTFSSNTNNNNPNNNNNDNNNNLDNNNNDNNNNDNNNQDNNNNNNQNDEFFFRIPNPNNNGNNGNSLSNRVINRNVVTNGPNGSFVRISHISDSKTDTSGGFQNNFKTIYYGRKLKDAETDITPTEPNTKTAEVV